MSRVARKPVFEVRQTCIIAVVKTKALISFAVTCTAYLICDFVFAFIYAKSRFSHDAAHIISEIPELTNKGKVAMVLVFVPPAFRIIRRRGLDFKSHQSLEVAFLTAYRGILSYKGSAPSHMYYLAGTSEEPPQPSFFTVILLSGQP